jgi:valyl-tRNA synthetase
MGWDDNGLPTERRVQNYYGVSCDPSLPYDPTFEPPAKPEKHAIAISRRNFVELCERLTAIDEEAFKALFTKLGLSVDWSLEYATINTISRRVAQKAFLRGLARGEAYSIDAPTLWDVDFQTAVAQAELEDRERPGAYHDIAFASPNGDITISTTRPELLPACVALVAHPDDERYQARFGTTVTTPLFGVEVPVVAHPLAQPDKGTGIAMICTFGDLTDVIWWRELQLPTRAIVGRTGRLIADTPWITTEAGAAAYAELTGKNVKQAQSRIVEMLAESGALLADPKPITHPVKFFEKGDRPLEIVASRQWYLRNGGRDTALRGDLLERGEELTWYPDHMRHRYSNWVEGLNGDWLVSRQRYFGVPFPVWYPVDADGEPNYDAPIVPDESLLPVDPSSDVPAGFTEAQRGQPGGFVGDPDVMDTWATSSLTPQIAGLWDEAGSDLFARVFPMDLRPQGHDIIRTWLFSTVVRANAEHHSLPWHNTMLSGWILDPDRKKMSKSKGNVVTPIGLLDQYGSDAVRYWSLCARAGVDTAFDEGQMKIGRKLAVKLLNASKFVLGLATEETTLEQITEPVDRALVVRLDQLVADATTAFSAYDHARALERTEQLFWWFCDDYLELVKGRAYSQQPTATSARAALRHALETFQLLLAPILSFAADEVWSWWHDGGSIHARPWPTPTGLLGHNEDQATLDVACWALGEIRKAKTTAKQSMRAAVESATFVHPHAALLAAATTDLRESGSLLSDPVASVGDEPSAVVVLAPTEG